MEVKLFPADVYQGSHKLTRAPFFPREKGLFLADAVGNIADAFQAHPDVLVFGGVSSISIEDLDTQETGKSLFYDATAAKLKTFVHGGGLVYVDGAISPKSIPTGKKNAQGKVVYHQDASFEKELTASPIAESPEG